jgi:hypothetical protein
MSKPSTKLRRNSSGDSFEQIVFDLQALDSDFNQEYNFDGEMQVEANMQIRYE